MKNGYITKYIRDNPHVDPLELVCMIFMGRSCIFTNHFHLFRKLKDASNGLNYLHTSGLVHGDLRAVRLTCPRDDGCHSIVVRRNTSL